MRLVTGCDVVDVARLTAVAERRPGFVARVFTDAEVADCTRGGIAPSAPVAYRRLAARFAAKEATRKAMGDLRLPFHAVEVVRDTGGAPQLRIHGRASDWSCSLSHDAGIAFAVVVGVATDPAPDDRRGAPADRPVPSHV